MDQSMKANCQMTLKYYRYNKMELKPCWAAKCLRQVAFVCKCTNPETYTCEHHLKQHTKDPGKIHQLNPLLFDPIYGTKEAICNYISQEIKKKEELKKDLLNSFSNHFCDLEQRMKEFLKKVDVEIEELQKYIDKVNHVEAVSKLEKDPLIKSLSLNRENAVLRVKKFIPESTVPPNYAKEIFGKSKFVKKMISCFIEDNLLNKILQIDSFLENCKASANENANELVKLQSYIQELIGDTEKIMQELEEGSLENKSKDSDIYSSDKYSSGKTVEMTFGKKDKESIKKPADPEIDETSSNIYLIDDKNLLIYDTDNEREEVIPLETEEPFDPGTCIARLPNGELFCFGIHPPSSGFALIIGKNYEIRNLPIGTPCNYSSATYFNGSIYCFGGIDVNYPIHSALSDRFDLNENRWNKLTPMTQVDAYCNSIIINGNILISGWLNKNLLRYSIDTNSFTTIPFEFMAEKRKLLINAERLYLIEYGNNGSVYECGMGSDTDWARVSASPSSNLPWQVYILNNKGEFYIGIFEYSFFEKHKKRYYKFNLDEKLLNELKNKQLKF
ncbi:unnamed protein product [Blepharisma stoltei]|uniref:Uncharacterized protein n=1 Tax=Blepharisma stoltei TaxID=1481888 RepID=A0AAU9K9M5_9CILI|nr:unnamed protein product [Blepharisma stoltei]